MPDTHLLPAAPTTSLDVRPIAPRERHARIFATFRALATGQAMELVNDHDPMPLYHQFQAEMPGRFSWDYLETGPLLWRVSISRLASAAAQGQCCGACGGGS